MTTSQFFSYLLQHEASEGLAIDLADAYLGRLQIEKARVGATAPNMARAS